MTDQNPNITIMKSKIEKAILEGKWLRFDYVAKKLEVSDRRVVDPKEIRGDKLFAMDMRKDGLRQFDLEGIQVLEVIEKGEPSVKPI